MAVNLVPSMNMFLGLREQNVTFCIDISGSMFNSIETVKEHLIQYLSEQSVLANLNVTRLFNLIAFSTEVYPWSNSCVLWNPATVNNAVEWIKDLETKTGTNTLDALLLAFDDPTTHSIVLVTDGIPDQEPYLLLNQISMVARGRPVHCIYISATREDDKGAIQFCQNLSTITRGTFKIVSVGRFGVEKITPMSTYDLCTAFQLSNLTLNASLPVNYSNSINLSSNFNQITNSNIYTYPKIVTAEQNTLVYPSLVACPRILVTTDGRIPLKSIAWSRYRPVRVLHDGSVIGLTAVESSLSAFKDIAYSPDAGSLLINKTVLARSALDGYYHKGKIISQILAHRFMIELGPTPNGKYKESYYQDTAIYDIIHYEDAIRHSIKLNDKVLAPFDSNDKYAPAEVLEGYERRDGDTSASQSVKNEPIVVKFANGKTRTLLPNEAIWLPDVMYERIKFELNLPSTARKYLEEANEDYPYKSLTGYPSLSLSNVRIDSVVMPQLIYDTWPYFVPYYPLYKNILYPATTLLNLTPTPGFLSSSYQPVYGRQIRSKPPAVNSDAMNNSVIGSTLTTEELDAKIRQQVNEHKHLLEGRCGSTSKSRESSPKDNVQTNHCSNHHNHHHHHHHHHQPHNHNNNNNHEKHNQDYENHHHHNHHNHQHNNQQTQHFDESFELTNQNVDYKQKYYELYKRLMQELYDDCKNESRTSFSRSKSVTFDDSRLDCTNSRSNRRCQCGSSNPDDMTTTSLSFSRDSSSASMQKRNKDRKSNNQNLIQNVPDRFGNPKVSVGFPEKTQRARSASGHLVVDNTFVNKTVDNLRDQLRREHVARREKSRMERTEDERKINELRAEYHRAYSNQVAELEKRRNDLSNQKNQDLIASKKAINANTIKKFESNKVDIEAKEQLKYAHLRNEATKRNMERMNKIHEQALKEANKLAFKRNQEDQRNQVYHDKIVIEEAIRNVNQKQAQLSHTIRQNKDNAREKLNAQKK